MVTLGMNKVYSWPDWRHLQMQFLHCTSKPEMALQFFIMYVALFYYTVPPFFPKVKFVPSE